jgi:1-acyl-sn-glycerol-3-phosphate acyltransferase
VNRVATDPQPATPVLVVRAALFWTGFALFTMVYAVLSLATAPFPFRYRYGFLSHWPGISLWWLEKTCKLRCHVEGLENIPAKAGIVFAKHQSTWETLALRTWFHPEAWVLKRELLWLPFFGWSARLVEPIALDRGAGKKAVEQLIEQGRDRLARGRWIMIFPEGTRIAPGRKGRYKIGGGALAEATGADVVPVAHNAGEYWPRRGFVKRPGVIEVRIGPPIKAHGKTAHEIVAEAEAWIEARMAEISQVPAAAANPS